MRGDASRLWMDKRYPDAVSEGDPSKHPLKRRCGQRKGKEASISLRTPKRSWRWGKGKIGGAHRP